LHERVGDGDAAFAGEIVAVGAVALERPCRLGLRSPKNTPHRIASPPRRVQVRRNQTQQFVGRFLGSNAWWYV